MVSAIKNTLSSISPFRYFSSKVTNQGPRRFRIYDGVLSIFDDRVPGLRLISCFLDQSGLERMQIEGSELSERVSLHRESHFSISWKDSDGRTINGQHYPRFGEGHQLTCFMGRENIPAIVQNNLISRISNLTEVRRLSPAPEWNCIFNTYRCPRNNLGLPGLEWPTDTPSNGKISLIYTSSGEGKFEIKESSQSKEYYPFIMSPGSLLVLSGPAREQMVHRITLRDSSPFDRPIGRDSFVLV